MRRARGSQPTPYLSCPVAGFCGASQGVIGNGLGPQIGVDFWQSGVWSPQDTGAVAGPLSCTSASFCLLVGAAYSQTSGDQTFDGYLTFVGTTWNAPVSVSGLDLMSEMSCVNTEFCVATTLSGSIAAFNVLDGAGGRGRRTGSYELDLPGSDVLRCARTPEQRICGLQLTSERSRSTTNQNR